MLIQAPFTPKNSLHSGLQTEIASQFTKLVVQTPDMRKILLFLGFLPLFSAAQEKAKPFSIQGKLKSLPHAPEWVFLQYRSNGEWKTDSARTQKGKFRFSGSLQEPVTATVRVKYAADEKGVRPAMVRNRDLAMIFIQPGKLKLTVTDSFSHLQLKGSPGHTEFTALTTAGKSFEKRLEPLYAKYDGFYKAKDQQGMDQTEKEMDAINAEKKELVFADFIRKNTASPVALYALQQYAGWDINPDKVEPLFDVLSEENKARPSALLLKEDLEIAKKTGIGRIAMDFTQNDTLGQPVSLSSLRGRYLLVDFWASWCGPCRAENPNVVKVFQKFKDRNFHIIGVSLDRPGQKEKWMKAIHDDKLDWTHVSDLQFWNNEVAKQYGIKAIPQNLLLDPEGKIIAKNLRGEELDAKLSEAIEGKKGF